MAKECSVPECTKPMKARSYCDAHWRRDRLYGSPTAPGIYARTREERLARNTERDPDSGCLLWTGAGIGPKRERDGQQYGYWGGEGSRYAHRNVWEYEHGPVPKGMLVDHICHNRACVELSHLRLASKAQNAQNRAAAAAPSSSGVRGVYQLRSGRWQARVRLGEGRSWIRSYDTLEEASAAVAEAREHYFGEFAGRG